MTGPRTPSRATLVQILLGSCLGVSTNLLAEVFLAVPVFSLLALNSVGFFSAAVLFGAPGLAGAALAFLLYGWWQSLSVGFLLACVSAYLLSGIVLYSTFSRVPSLGRGMPNSKSFRWFTAASGLCGLFSALVITLAGRPEHFWIAAGAWMRSTVVSIWVLTPPLLILGDRLLRRWLVPIPGEIIVSDFKNFRIRESRGSKDGLWKTHLVEDGRAFGWGLLRVGALSLVAGCVAWGVALWFPELNNWVTVLFLIPVYRGARRLRLPGGLVAAAIVSMTFMTMRVLLPEMGSVESPLQGLDVYAQLLIFWLVGGVLGEGQEREARLRSDLAANNELLRQDLQRVVRALTGAVEAKDVYTEGHLQRVNSYSLAVGRRLGLSPEELELLQMASALHDVGKIGIPERILNKKGPLDDEERRIMQRHPEIGARILANLEGLAKAAPAVLHHQERYDGRLDGEFPGYPTGVSGDQIPLGARIIAVVDAFDAMTTTRPYREGMPVSHAVSVLEEERGKQFDPIVVETFLGILSEDPWA